MYGTDAIAFDNATYSDIAIVASGQETGNGNLKSTVDTIGDRTRVGNRVGLALTSAGAVCILKLRLKIERRLLCFAKCGLDSKLCLTWTRRRNNRVGFQSQEFHFAQLGQKLL